MSESISTSPPRHPKRRRVYEQERLIAEVTENILALLAAAGVSQRELAGRLGITEARVSHIVRGRNLGLRSLSDIAWALGYRFELVPVPSEREGTPARNDPEPPTWLDDLRREIRA